MKKPNAILAIHDVTPKWEREITSIYKTIKSIEPNCSPALLIVPFFHRQWQIQNNSSFVEHIKSWIAEGSEPILHGWAHLSRRSIPVYQHPLKWVLSKTLTAGEGEFLDLSPSRTATRLADGKALLEQTFATPISGFVPPAWLRNRLLFDNLASFNMRFTEGHLFLYDIKNNTRHFMPAITFSGRTPSRAAASVRWANCIERLLGASCDIRLALHPSDWHSAALRMAIERLVASIGRTHSWTRYDELLSSWP